jgi:hypothetical protein
MMSKNTKATAVMIMLTAFMISGCAQRFFYNPAKSETARAQDLFACQSDSMQALPTSYMPVQTSGGYQQLGGTSCTSNSTYNTIGSYGTSQGKINCTNTGGNYIPPRYTYLDFNERQRNQYVVSCMAARGYQYLTQEELAQQQAVQPMAINNNSKLPQNASTSVTSINSKSTFEVTSSQKDIATMRVVE